MARQTRVKKGAPPGQAGGRARRPMPLTAFFEDTRTRSASIPIFLWICAAVVAHLAGGGGAMEAAEAVHDADELRAAVRAERVGLRPGDSTIELLTDNAEPTPQNIEPPKDDPNAEAKPDPNAEPEADPDHPTLDKPKPPPPVKAEPPKPEKPKPEPPKAKEPDKPKPPPPPLKPLAPVAAAPAAPPPPPPPPPPMEVDHRQAIRQIVEKNQKDNPTASRTADEANHTEKETVARARTQDMDSPKPTMGASSGSPKDENIGNSKDDHSGSAEKHAGDEKHAPGESKAAATDSEHEKPAPPVPATPNGGPPPSAPGAQGRGTQGMAPSAPAAPPSPGGAGPASPEVVSGDRGTYTLDPANPGGNGKSRFAGRKRPPGAFQTPVHVGALGLGGTGMPNGPQLNLNMHGVEAAVGNEQLARERAADGAARLVAHRGKGPKNNFEKFRGAIENYEPLARLDNTTSLNAAAAPFSTYKVTIHNRIHPIFAEQDLPELDDLGKAHPVNEPSVFTSIEIVLDKNTGAIVHLGVVKPSGFTMFDLQALDAITRAAPFGKAPEGIASPDDNVYLHWEFHRNPFDACTTRNAYPFILKAAPKKPVTPVGPTRKPPAARPDERTAPSGPLTPR